MSDENVKFRKAIYALLIAVAIGSLIGRIWNVESRSAQTPFLSANDMSRWCTIRALVDHGTYSIDDVMYAKDKKTRWSTIDKVYHLGPDGKRHFYSSKPTLMPTIMAGQYWVIKHTVGISIAQRPFYVGRMMLTLTQCSLMLVYFIVLAQIIERYGKTDWGRVFVFACAGFGTFITTFGVTLNNHSFAAVACLIAIDCWLKIWVDGRREYRLFFITAVAAAFTAANELPALSLFGLLGFTLLLKDYKKTLIAGVPGALVVIIPFFITNYIAHGVLPPPYMHRSDGAILAELPVDSATQFNQSSVDESLRKAMSGISFNLSDSPKVEVREPGQRWVLDDAILDRQWALQKVENKIEIRQWDNWYDYRGTYWKVGSTQGIDKGEPSKAVYALHMLIGHHGVFSLTPIWIFSFLGLGMLVQSKDTSWKQFAALVLFLTVLCVAFYIFRPLKDRNYGGVTCGFRWLFWFIPLWLIAMIPAADRISKNKWAKLTASILLGISAISASYAAMNPWSHPWMYDYLEYLGWITP
ncbi:MAG: hypothetical protein ACKVH8_06145 [Pirellulales bacterium]